MSDLFDLENISKKWKSIEKSCGKNNGMRMKKQENKQNKKKQSPLWIILLTSLHLYEKWDCKAKFR